MAGGYMVHGNHGDGNGRWRAAVLQRAATAGNEKSA